MQTTTDVQAAFTEQEPAITAFEEGDPAPYLACWSHTDDVTIFGGWGAYEKGWEEVGPRMEWAAARFHGAHMSTQILAMGQSGDLAYAIYFEKGEARIGDADEFHPLVLRVTVIYRREAGTWKIIHRHADPILQKTEAPAILQRR